MVSLEGQGSIALGLLWVGIFALALSLIRVVFGTVVAEEDRFVSSCPVPIEVQETRGWRLACGSEFPRCRLFAWDRLLQVDGCLRSPRGMSASSVWLLGGTADLNRLSHGDMMRIDGVGEVLATRLIRARDRLGGFRSWGQLDDIKGVGPSLLRTLKRWTVVEPGSFLLGGLACTPPG